MLTGDETPSGGQAEIMGFTLSDSRRSFLSQIGYCPQFDSIIPELTGREMLTLMARVRGVKMDMVKGEVDKWTRFLGIQDFVQYQPIFIKSMNDLGSKAFFIELIELMNW